MRPPLPQACRSLSPLHTVICGVSCLRSEGIVRISTPVAPASIYPLFQRLLFVSAVPIIRTTPLEPDMTMARAFLIIHLTAAAAVLASASAASAAGDPGRQSGNSFTLVTMATAPGSRVVTPHTGNPPGDRRVTNTFSLVTGAAPAQSRVVGSSNDAGIGSSKPVVSNPYQVPLLQNAGSMGGLR